MKKTQARWFVLCLAAACFTGCGDDSNDSTVSCKDMKCPAGTTCNEKTVTCDPVVDKCKDVTCESGKVCDPATGDCKDATSDKCKGVKCDSGQTCNPETGQCEGEAKPGKCDGVTCGAGEVCNPTTGECEDKEQNPEDKCKTVTCGAGTVCNPETGKCEGEATCTDDKDCKWDPDKYTETEYCNKTTGKCENSKCQGKTWNKDYQYCSVTGIVQCYPGYCDNSGMTGCACDGECNLETHRCANTCGEVEGNIVINGSFEDWTEGKLDAWVLDQNSVTAGGKVEKSTHASACKMAAKLTSSSAKIDRLESLPMSLGVQSFTGGNAKYKCTIDAFGYGNLNLGYRLLDADGKKVSEKTTAHQADLWGSDSYSTYEFEISADTTKTPYAQILIGFDRKNDSAAPAEITLDNLVCVADGNICDGVKCEEWEICSVNSKIKENGEFVGKCVARDGFCTMEKTPKEGELEDSCKAKNLKCNTTTHLCEMLEGKCLRHEDCEEGQKCELSPKADADKKNTCVTGDRCEGVTCKSEWQACNPTSGKCALAADKCLKSMDCPTKEAPLCDYTTHTCVAMDAKVGDKPLNIVPNGGFEEWEEVTLGGEKEYHLPVSWFGTGYKIYPTHLVTEFDPKNVHEYTKNVHGGTKALQLVYAKDKQSKRFSSEGFDVSSVGTSYDCSYFVRGKGSVRIHSFSSLGDMTKTEFTHIDSEEWTRIPFSIKGGTDLRLVLYVGSTDASKDHIQIDDVSCVKWTY